MVKISKPQMLGPGLALSWTTAGAMQYLSKGPSVRPVWYTCRHGLGSLPLGAPNNNCWPTFNVGGYLLHALKHATSAPDDSRTRNDVVPSGGAANSAQPLRAEK